MTPDPVLDNISEALDLFNAGRRAEARSAFAAIWSEIELPSCSRTASSAAQVSRRRVSWASLGSLA